MRKIVYVLLVFMLLAACSNEEGSSQDNEAKGKDVKEKMESTNVPDSADEGSDESENVFPLTGIETDKKVNDRIVSVMVNNHDSARPQSGLSKADIVFEILAEGNITRLLAFYQSEMPKVVGPVRSAREYYFELANSYNALYVYHGAANVVNDMIEDRGIEHLDGSIYDNNGTLFKRESFREAPHNSYLQFAGVYDYASQKGYETTASYDPLPFLGEGEVRELPGDAANHVEIVYSNNPMQIVEFSYDENSETYTRYNDREQTVDLNSSDPIEVDNVFIIETEHEVIDDTGRRAIDLESGGNGYLIQKGQIQEVQWDNQDGRIIPVKDEVPVGFVPGKTWVNVVPTSPGIGQAVSISN
ncbi:DUF3048 domain-containing protein [Virgibacillus sp. NKC19-16]|uniref:DUF3048 domain-containing protein n=1 Tax=Virgibacillus salidurans TaxID=2831673 RepID=UPI001F16F299|nr:DUF3048 domain-containing protein [Virgibacillus sp. NKC19-16]UJL47251.1 DUF3048 domain-containing protein [Virgibacillus sp. NKC19-16]